LDIDPCPMGETSGGRLHVAKSRFGVQGTVGLRFDGARGTFVADVVGSLTAEQRRVYEAISGGAETYDDAAKAAELRKKDFCRVVKVLVVRGIITTNPLKISPQNPSSAAMRPGTGSGTGSGNLAQIESPTVRGGSGLGNPPARKSERFPPLRGNPEPAISGSRRKRPGKPSATAAPMARAPGRKF
jgi:hypothetical protein